MHFISMDMRALCVTISVMYYQSSQKTYCIGNNKYKIGDHSLRSRQRTQSKSTSTYCRQMKYVIKQLRNKDH